jgi:hypothetical protein
LGEEHVPALVAAWQAEFYIDDLAVRRAVLAQRSFNVIHLESMYKADVFVLKNEPYAREQMRRRRQEVLKSGSGEFTVWFCSAEDSVVQKLHWLHKGGGGSDQQWRDLTGVLKVQATKLDLAYMQHWAVQLGLSDLLAQALADAGLAGPGES